MLSKEDKQRLVIGFSLLALVAAAIGLLAVFACKAAIDSEPAHTPEEWTARR